MHSLFLQPCYLTFGEGARVLLTKALPVCSRWAGRGSARPRAAVRAIRGATITREAGETNQVTQSKIFNVTLLWVTLIILLMGGWMKLQKRVSLALYSVCMTVLRSLPLPGYVLLWGDSCGPELFACWLHPFLLGLFCFTGDSSGAIGLSSQFASNQVSSSSFFSRQFKFSWKVNSICFIQLHYWSVIVCGTSSRHQVILWLYFSNFNLRTELIIQSCLAVAMVRTGRGGRKMSIICMWWGI